MAFSRRGRARWSGWLAAVALLSAAGAGCRGDDEGGGDAGVSLDAGTRLDLCACLPDMAQCTSHPAGVACTRDEECCPSWWPGHRTASCVKETTLFGKKVAWPDGYCSAACRRNLSNQFGHNVTDCPAAESVCSPDGRCLAPCRSVADCRAGYVCSQALSTPLPVCIPAAVSACDPPGDPAPTGRSCPPGDRCQANSPDDSLGWCFTPCDPVAQGCGDEKGCYLLVSTPDAVGACNPIPPKPGADFFPQCDYNFDCPPTYYCVANVCRRYCRTGTTDAGGVPAGCSMGLTCKDLVVPGKVISFHADQLGVCLP